MISDNKNKLKKNNFFLIISCIVVFVFVAASILFIYNQKEKTKQEEERIDQENIAIDEWTSEVNQLWNDFTNGVITTDEYVQYSLYYYYNPSLLDSKYLNIKNYEIHLDDLIDKYYDELSEETLNLYIKYTNLENITFIQNNDSSVKPMANETSSDTTKSLDKVYLSSNGNFVIWYTTTGTSATTEEMVKSYADTLENAITNYKNILGYDYVFHSTVIREGKRYQNQIKILEENNISKDYLTSAMQVYIFNFNNTNVSGYYTRGYDVKNDSLMNYIFNYFNDGNSDDVIITPYISINSGAKSESDKEVINHEIFHHYQNYIISNKETPDIVTDTLIGEATANWASSKITINHSLDNALNLWVSNYIKHTSDILGEMYKQKGHEVGYAMFIYLTAYENNVDNSINKILNSIHQEDGLKYLNENATIEELNNTINELAFKNLSLNYTNNNFYPLNGDTIKIIDEIDDDSKKKGLKTDNVTLSPIGIDYYLIDVSSDETFNLNLSSFGEERITFNLIAKTNNVYTVVDSKSTIDSSVELDTSSFGDYDQLYIAVTNSDLQNSHNYKIEITTGVVKNKTTFKTNFNNYRIRATSTMVMYGMTTNISMEGIVDELHQKEYLKTISQVMGISVTTESYVDFHSGYTYTQIPFTDGWEKAQGATSFIDLTLFMKKFEENDEITKVNDTQYKVRLTEDDITKLPNYDSSLSNYELNGDIYVTVSINNGYISKLEYDFSNLIAEIEQFTMTIDFYDYNNAGDVNIPISVTGSV